MLHYKKLLTPLIKKSKGIFFRTFRIKIETVPKTHFLVRLPIDEYRRCIKESFNGTWESITKINAEHPLLIDTFVTNQKHFSNAICKITVEELNAFDEIITTFSKSYKIAEKMENWKWVNHIFNTNDAQPTHH